MEVNVCLVVIVWLYELVKLDVEICGREIWFHEM